MDDKNNKILEHLFNFVSETEGLNKEELKKSFEQDGIDIDGLKQKCFRFMHKKSEYYHAKEKIASFGEMTKDDSPVVIGRPGYTVANSSNRGE